jgi:DNA-binding MarR family transcriptional regulator
MADLELTPAELKALRSLDVAKESQTKTVLTKGGLDADALAKLVAAGYIAELPLAKGAKAQRFAITDAGRQTIASLPAPKPVRAARVSSVVDAANAETHGQSIEINAALAELRTELRAGFAELRTLLTALVTSSKTTTDPITPSAVPFDPIAFRKALRTTIPEINRRDRHDGLVPIGKIRRTLAYLGLDRPTFDAALLEEERAYTVDLKIANDPSRVKDPEEGISIEGRGLLYFVVLR